MGGDGLNGVWFSDFWHAAALSGHPDFMLRIKAFFSACENLPDQWSAALENVMYGITKHCRGEGP